MWWVISEKDSFLLGLGTDQADKKDAGPVTNVGECCGGW